MDSLTKLLYTLFIIQKLGSFYAFFILSVFLVSSFSFRIFQYTTLSDEILSSHHNVNELCYAAGFININSIVTK
jgi:hypothetical protein